MGKSKQVNVLQSLRLKLKSGYLKEEPETFKFMKRYPPMNNDDNMILRKKKHVDVRPLTNLYTRAVEKNSLFVDEMVYPAYWRHEPLAFTLAKKQYEFIQSGLSENEAYKKAVSYVDVLEEQSYTQMKELIAGIEMTNAKLPIFSNPKVASKLSFWHQKLQGSSYESLPLASKGEIDYIIQTDILGWNEIERERRMRDPVFVMQFDKIRSLVFPEIFSESSRERKRRELFKKSFLRLHNIDPVVGLKTKQPFFYEDYQHFFYKALNEKMPFFWTAKEQERYSEWVNDTLFFATFRENTDRRAQLGHLKSIFFPMLRLQNKSYSIPSVDELKKILYDNDIGYKTIDGKLYIRRFYLLPQLIFPEETAYSRADRNGLNDKKSSDDSLLKDLKGVVSSAVSLTTLQQRLGGPSSKIPGSHLKNLYSQRDDLAQGPGISSSLPKQGVGSDFEENEDDFGVQKLSLHSPEPTKTISSKPLLAESPEWESLLEKHNIHLPGTSLERDRDALFKAEDPYKLEDSTDEVDLYRYRRTRQENMLLVRARLFAAYEEKEAARRSSEWKARGVWMDLPRADIELLDPREGKLMQKNYREAEGQITNSTQSF